MSDPKIILFDIETLPDLHKISEVFFSLSDWPGRTRSAQVNSVLCVSWKVFGENKVQRLKLWDYYPHDKWQENKNNDKPLLADLKKVMDGAHAVVAHNGVRFDWPFLQTRLALHDMDFMTDVPKIDTCLLCRKKFNMHSNSLKNLGFNFFGEDKLETGGQELWHRIQMYGYKKDFKLMADYCDQDVILLEKLFKKVRPFAKNIPNYNNFRPHEKEGCPNCGSTRISKWGFHYTKTQVYQRYKCKDCASDFRTNKKDKQPRSL